MSGKIWLTSDLHFGQVMTVSLFGKSEDMIQFKQ